MSTVSNATATKVVSPSQLAHIVLRTNNYDRMVKYWSTFLGADVVFSSKMMSLLTYDEEHHRIGIFNLPSIGPKNRMTSGLEHIAFAFSTLDALVLSWKQRKEQGIEPFWSVNHGPTISIYYNDPDGNIIETQVDTMSAEEASRYLTSEEFEINPIGVDFEVEDLIKRLESGEDRAAIMKRPASGPRDVSTVPGVKA